MYPPGPFPSSPGGAPAHVAAQLTHQLAAYHITGIYTAATVKFAVISVTADLTLWTDGHLLWCTYHGQRHTWPAADVQAAASDIAALARPAAR